MAPMALGNLFTYESVTRSTFNSGKLSLEFKGIVMSKSVNVTHLSTTLILPSSTRIASAGWCEGSPLEFTTGYNGHVRLVDTSKYESLFEKLHRSTPL